MIACTSFQDAAYEHGLGHVPVPPVPGLDHHIFANWQLYKWRFTGVGFRICGFHYETWWDDPTNTCWFFQLGPTTKWMQMKIVNHPWPQLAETVHIHGFWSWSRKSERCVLFSPSRSWGMKLWTGGVKHDFWKLPCSGEKDHRFLEFFP